MELTLNKINYFQIGTINQKCAVLIPNSETTSNLTQKLVVGDRNGLLQILGMKKQQSKIIFKCELGIKISRIVLGGNSSHIGDKIYVACGTQVNGYSKKGKQFMAFTTNLSESIDNIYVDGKHLLVTGKYIYRRYNNLADTDYYLCPDQIHDILCLPVSSHTQFIAILACRDRIIRVLNESTLKYEIEVDGPPSVLCLYCNTGGSTGNSFVYGTSDGRIGLITLSETGPIINWEITSEDDQSSVSSIGFYDVIGDGDLRMIVAKNSGEVEMYNLDMDEDNEPPVQIHKQNTNLTVTSISAGKFSSATNVEIVCTSYSGWVIGLTTQSSIKSVDDKGNLTIDPEVVDKIDHLKKTLVDLTEEINQDQAMLGSAKPLINTSRSTNASSGNLGNIGVQYSHKFVLSPTEAAYLLTIESQHSIDFLLVQSDTAIDLLDTEHNHAVVSFSNVNPDSSNTGPSSGTSSAPRHLNGNKILATFRCQANTTKLDIKIRSIEGQYGTLRLYITPKSTIRTCQLIQIPIRPLSLHHRIHKSHSQSENSQEIPWNSLVLTGRFSLVEMHNWIGFCLPDTPDKYFIGEETCQLDYESTFLGTQLQCNYRRGQVTFKSDNLSTISILKDVLTKEATKKGISLDISYEIDDRSVEHVLRLVNPKIDSLLLLAKKVQLIEPLKELMINEQGLDNDKSRSADAIGRDDLLAGGAGDYQSFLSKDYCDILNHADELREKFKKQPCHLERLYGIITDLYIDKFKFQGHDVRNNIQELIEILDSYKLDRLIEFFNRELVE